MRRAKRESNVPLSVERLYAETFISPDALDAALDRSPPPRAPEMLFEVIARLGIQPGQRVLDVGCRDGRHLVELARRFDVSAVGVDLVWANLARGRARLGERFGEHGRIAMLQGRAELLPFRSASFPFLWIRDVLIHVVDLAASFRECRRVLTQDGRAVVYQMFATSWLSRDEAARFWPPLGAVARNADPEYFESRLVASGLRVVERDEISSEWREHAEKSGERRTSTQLLRAARMLRDPGRLRAEIGDDTYESELANALWGVYQMIGKLSGRVYVLAPR